MRWVVTKGAAAAARRCVATGRLRELLHRGVKLAHTMSRIKDVRRAHRRHQRLELARVLRRWASMLMAMRAVVRLTGLVHAAIARTMTGPWVDGLSARAVVVGAGALFERLSAPSGGAGSSYASHMVIAKGLRGQSVVIFQEWSGAFEPGVSDGVMAVMEGMPPEGRVRAGATGQPGRAQACGILDRAAAFVDMVVMQLSRSSCGLSVCRVVKPRDIATATRTIASEVAPTKSAKARARRRRRQMPRLKPAPVAWTQHAAGLIATHAVVSGGDCACRQSLETMACIHRAVCRLREVQEGAPLHWDTARLMFGELCLDLPRRPRLGAAGVPMVATGIIRTRSDVRAALRHIATPSEENVSLALRIIRAALLHAPCDTMDE